MAGVYQEARSILHIRPSDQLAVPAGVNYKKHQSWSWKAKRRNYRPPADHGDLWFLPVLRVFFYMCVLSTRSVTAAFPLLEEVFSCRGGAAGRASESMFVDLKATERLFIPAACPHERLNNPPLVWPAGAGKESKQPLKTSRESEQRRVN